MLSLLKSTQNPPRHKISLKHRCDQRGVWGGILHNGPSKENFLGPPLVSSFFKADAKEA